MTDAIVTDEQQARALCEAAWRLKTKAQWTNIKALVDGNWQDHLPMVWKLQSCGFQVAAGDPENVKQTERRPGWQPRIR